MDATHAALSASKQALRKRMMAARQAVSFDDAALMSTSVRARLAPLCTLDGIKTVALFASIRNEVDLAPLVPTLREAGRKVAFPRLVGDAASGAPSRGTLEFCFIEDLADLAKEPRFGIPEPKPDLPAIDLDDLDMVVVPGLAFDREGRRLGWGVGYYDRVLPNMSAKRVGACFSLQLVDRCPAGTDDVPMDALVTEHNLFLFGDAAAADSSPFSRFR